MDFLENLEPLLRTFWYIAIPTSLFFIVQTILTFLGGDAMDGVEADFDSDFSDTEAPFQLFSLRNLVNFLLGFSWTGISFYEYIINDWILIIVSLVVGILFVYLFFIIINQVQKLAEDNTFKMESVINQTAQVYTNIPAHLQGTGKIMISINGSTRELEAMTEGPAIKANTLVLIKEIRNNNLPIVKSI